MIAYWSNYSVKASISVSSFGGLEEVAYIDNGITKVELVPIFGARCGRRFDKMEDISFEVQVNGGALALIEESGTASENTTKTKVEA